MGNLCLTQEAQSLLCYDLKGWDGVGREVQEGEDMCVCVCVCVYIYIYILILFYSKTHHNIYP